MLRIGNQKMAIKMDFAEKPAEKPQEAAPAEVDPVDVLEKEADQALDSGQIRAAALTYEMVLQKRPRHQTWNNYSVALFRAGLMVHAAEAAAQALNIHYSSPAMVNMANAVANYGDCETAMTLLWNTWTRNPTRLDAWQVLLVTAQASDEMDPRALALLHRIKATLYKQRLAPKRLMYVEEPKGRAMRIGYISADFRQHSVAYFAEGVIRAHDPKVAECYVYSTGSSDRVTERILSVAHHGRECPGLSMDGLEYLLMQDKLDVLIELAGPTAGNHLEVISRRVAPVQVSWIGYPHSTGCPEIDYRFGDRWTIGEDWADEFTETPWPLPYSHAYRPDDTAEAVVPSIGAREPGQVVFGTACRLAKRNPTTMQLWSQVLREMPQATFRWKTGAFNDPKCRDMVWDQFEKLGVERKRVVLDQPIPEHADALRWYENVDVVLDTLPYCGTTTTCEALYCGLPVVAGVGRTPASRVAESLSRACGAAPLMVKNNPEAYVREALDIGRAEGVRVAMRHEGRGKLLASPLCDTTRMARDVEAACAAMLRKEKPRLPHKTPI